MEQEPYEFWICPANLESQGEATQGAFRKYAFLASQKMFFSARTRTPNCPESVQRRRYTREVAGPGEKMGDKENVGGAPQGGHKYDAKSIKVLGGLEAVRLRPAMYIGSTGEMGVHPLVWEVVDNSVDEGMGGLTGEINVTVHADEAVTGVDNGRGIPVDMDATEKHPAAEVSLTSLHSGRKI